MFSKNQRFLVGSTILSFVISLVFVCLLRFLGILEPYELKLLDHFFLKGQESVVSEQIVIVTITENDIKRLKHYPLSDRQLVQILESIVEAQPRVIGLDLIRDLAVYAQSLSLEENQLAYQQLQTIFRETNNLYGIAKITNTPKFPSIPGSSILREHGRLTAGDLVLDRDGVARKGNLYPDFEQPDIPGLGLATALKYLEAEQIYPEESTQLDSRACPLPKYYEARFGEKRSYPQEGWLKFGSAVLCPFTPRFGSYTTHTSSGYQILINWHSAKRTSFNKITVSDILDNSFDPSLLKDRLVLMGNTSLSVKDLFFTPLSNNTGSTPELMSGIEIIAHLASQIINIGQGKSKPIYAWRERDEIVWIFLWGSCLQFVLFRLFQFKKRFFGVLSLSSLTFLVLASYYLTLYFFLFGGIWLPLLPIWLCFSIQTLFAIIIFFTWQLILANKNLESIVQERTKSLQQAQQKMLAQEKLNFLGKNVVYLSHEIRNPLGAIELANLISLDVVKSLSEEESLSEEDTTDLLDNCNQIKAYIKRINQTITILNSHVRDEDSQPENCNIKEVINKCVKMTVPSFSLEKLQIQRDYDPALMPTQLYLPYFERAIYNLIENSLYTLKQKQALNPNFSPQLLVAVKQLDGRVKIAIEDNGEGINPKYERRVFEEFFTTKKSQGTGLGLFFVQQIIEGKHGGTISLATEWGEFTRFTIVIPQQ